MNIEPDDTNLFQAIAAVIDKSIPPCAQMLDEDALEVIVLPTDVAI